MRSIAINDYVLNKDVYYRSGADEISVQFQNDGFFRATDAEAHVIQPSFRDFQIKATFFISFGFPNLFT